jgi:nucleotide sugar dehydrogenase
MEYSKQLIEKIQEKKARVCIIGLGNVGLKLATEIAEEGYITFGIDIDEYKIKLINEGFSYINDVSELTIKKLIKSEVFKVSTSYELVKDADIIIIAVNTPLDEYKIPNFDYLRMAIEELLKYDLRGKLIILESTVYPGATEEIIGKRLSKVGYKIGEEIFIAYSPERIDPGSNIKFKEIPKIVSGLTETCAKLVEEFYKKIIKAAVYKASSTKVAEMTKLLENLFRLVNISLIYQIAILCEEANINVWEVIELAKTKPFGFLPFYPGPGAGGACIPKDPRILLWWAKKYSYLLEFIETAVKINDEMPYYIYNKILEILNKNGISAKNSRILIIGVSYKKNINDTRESAAIKVIKLLLELGVKISYHDPYVPSINIDGHQIRSIELNSENIKNNDLVAIFTDHDSINYELIFNEAKFILDTRNVFKNRHLSKIYTLGKGQNF